MLQTVRWEASGVKVPTKTDAQTRARYSSLLSASATFTLMKTH